MIAVIAGSIDFVQVRDNGRPIIGKLSVALNLDGGTRVWLGPGYKIQRLHRITSGFGEENDRLHYEVGPVLEPWLLFSIPVFRNFLERDSTGIVYYNDSKPIYVVGYSEENWIFETSFKAIEELLPYVFFFALFWAYWLLINRFNLKPRIRHMESPQ